MTGKLRDRKGYFSEFFFPLKADQRVNAKMKMCRWPVPRGLVVAWLAPINSTRPVPLTCFSLHGWASASRVTFPHVIPDDPPMTREIAEPIDLPTWTSLCQWSNT